MTEVIAYNRAAAAVLEALERVPADRRTLLERWFVDWPAEQRPPTWADTGRSLVARFRAEHARHVGERAYAELIARLRAASPEFAAWWDGHDISEAQRGSKTVEHPGLGTLRFQHAQLIPTGAADLRLTVYAPADAVTRAALARL
jgi:hypothetical protein